LFFTCNRGFKSLAGSDAVFIEEISRSLL